MKSRRKVKRWTASHHMTRKGRNRRGHGWGSVGGKKVRRMAREGVPTPSFYDKKGDEKSYKKRTLRYSSEVRLKRLLKIHEKVAERR